MPFTLDNRADRTRRHPRELPDTRRCAHSGATAEIPARVSTVFGCATGGDQANQNRAPDFLPFTKELPKDTTSQKIKSKGGAKGAAKDKTADAVSKTADKLKDVKV